DGADLLMREQLEAADVGPRQEDERGASLQPGQGRPDEVRAKVDLASGGRLGEGGAAYIDVGHLGETLTRQEPCGQYARGSTHAGEPSYPELRRLRRGLCGDPPGGQAKQPGGPRERQAPEEAPAAASSNGWGTHRHLPVRGGSVRPGTCECQPGLGASSSRWVLESIEYNAWARLMMKVL